jgi:hypothetical protein
MDGFAARSRGRTQIVSRSENLHGKILRETAVTRLRRHDDILVDDAAAGREIACA